MVGSAEQVTLQHAVQQGFLTPAQLQRAEVEAAERSRAGQATTTLGLVCSTLGPAQVAVLQAVYRQAERSGSGRIPADDTRTVAPASGPSPVPPQRSGATLQHAVEAYRSAAAQEPTFAPHAGVAFETVETLGEGGMGVVLRVNDRRLGRPAALKRIRGEADPAAVARFRREAEITAQLDHPSIPPVFEAGIDPAGDHYMLMKVIEGDPLSERIEAAFAAGPAPIDRTGTIGVLLEGLVKVGEAIAYAHSRGVLHRDLKPANVMVGRFGEVLVLDWGLARRRTDSAEDDALLRSVEPVDDAPAELTQAGSLLGTPGYMAPEQADGEADERSDVFGLGAILVSILTNAPPIEGATAINRINKTLKGEVTLPRDRRRDVPPELNAIAAAALAPDPAQRMPTALAFVRNLRAFLAGETVEAHRYSPFERLGRSARKHPTLVAAASVAAVLLVVGLGVVLRTQRAVAVETRQAVAREGLDSARAAAQESWASAEAKPDIGAALRALTAAQRWSNLAEEDAEAQSALTRAARRLGDLAIASQQWDLAEAALALVGEEDRAASARVEEARRRTQEVRDLLARAESGELTRKRDGIPDAVYEVTRYAEPATVAVLVRVLKAIARELLAVEAKVLRSTGTSPELEAALAIRAKTPIHSSLPQRALGPLIAAERAVAKRAGVRSDSRDATRQAFLSRVADRQAAEIKPGRFDLARLAIQALGRIGIDAGAVEALGEYVKVEADDRRARVAIEALNRFPSELATSSIRVASQRRPNNSYFRTYARDLFARRSNVSIGPLPEGASAKRLIEIGNERETHGELHAALLAYTRATQVSPRQTLPWLSRALCRRRLKDFAGALEDVDRALQLNPRSAAAFSARGLIYATSNEHASALEAYSRSLELNPDQIPVWINRGQLHLRLQNLTAARTDLDTAIAKGPNDADAWAARGAVRRAQGEMLGAIDDCTKALALNPNHAVAYFNRGTAQFDRSVWQAAAHDFQRALDLDPALVSARNGLARTYFRQGLLEKAAQQASASLRQDPDNLAALWLRSAVYEQAKKLGPAIADLERILQLAPSHGLVEEVRKRLHALRRR